MKKEEMITVVTKEGLRVEGSADTIKKLFGDSILPAEGYYYSETKDRWYKIADMASMHIKNAIVKYFNEFVIRLRNAKGAEAFLAIMDEGPNELIWDLEEELTVRKSIGLDLDFYPEKYFG